MAGRPAGDLCTLPVMAEHVLSGQPAYEMSEYYQDGDTHNTQRYLERTGKLSMKLGRDKLDASSQGPPGWRTSALKGAEGADDGGGTPDGGVGWASPCIAVSHSLPRRSAGGLLLQSAMQQINQLQQENEQLRLMPPQCPPLHGTALTRCHRPTAIGSTPGAARRARGPPRRSSSAQGSVPLLPHSAAPSVPSGRGSTPTKERGRLTPTCRHSARLRGVCPHAHHAHHAPAEQHAQCHAEGSSRGAHVGRERCVRAAGVGRGAPRGGRLWPRSAPAAAPAPQLTAATPCGHRVCPRTCRGARCVRARSALHDALPSGPARCPPSGPRAHLVTLRWPSQYFLAKGLPRAATPQGVTYLSNQQRAMLPKAIGLLQVG